MRQITFVQIETLRICISLRRLSVDNQDTWNLGKLSKNYFVLILYSSYYSIFEQVAISFVVFILGQLYERNEIKI
jgi:hypothetical protein